MKQNIGINHWDCFPLENKIEKSLLSFFAIMSEHLQQQHYNKHG